MSVVGFDFGNKSCVVVVARQRGINVVLNDESKRETPAIICFDDKQRFLSGFIWLVMILLLLVFVNVDRKPIVSILGVPNHMTYADFCHSCGSFIHHLLEMRILSTLIGIDDQYSADSFYKHFNGKHFSSLDEETCHMLFTVDIQYTGSIELSQSSPESSAEHPSCPVCLVVLLICVTKVAKSSFDKALAEHEDIDIL
ncbi:hypothetical protein OROHE_001121 [Orobanche hederae]